MKSKVSTLLPYKLVPSPTHFRALVPGRRKALEVSDIRPQPQPLNVINSGHGHVPSARLMRPSGGIRRRQTIILILVPGTFFLGLQTQDYLFIKPCLNLRRPTRPLGREHPHKSPHQHSIIRSVRPVDLSRRATLRHRTARGKARQAMALVVPFFHYHAFHF
jgi:hypothetical protein